MQVQKLFTQRKKKQYRKIIVTFTRKEIQRNTVLGLEHLVSTLRVAGIPLIVGSSKDSCELIGVRYGSFERFDNVNTRIVVFTWILDKPHIKKVYKKKILDQSRRIRI